MDLRIAGSPEWLGPDVLGMAHGERGVVWVVRDSAGDMVLQAYGMDGIMLSSHEIGIPTHEQVQTPLPMMAQHKCVYLAVGDTLYLFDAGVRRTQQIVTRGAIRVLTGSAPYSRRRLAVLTGRYEGKILWTGSLWGTNQNLLDLPEMAVAGFRRDGALVVCGQDRGQVFSTAHVKVTPSGRFPAPPRRPIAVLPGRYSYQFAVVTASGEVLLYRDQDDE